MKLRSAVSSKSIISRAPGTRVATTSWDNIILRKQLTLQIYKIVKARKLTQAQAGALLGIKQPNVSALIHNRSNFSIGRLMEFLTALGQDVKITVKPTRKEWGETVVVIKDEHDAD